MDAATDDPAVNDVLSPFKRKLKSWKSNGAYTLSPGYKGDRQRI